MLAKRLIATILLANGKIVQSKQFKHTNIIGNAYTAIDFFNSWSVDEIVILDVTRTPDFRPEFLKIVEGFTDRCFVPLTVGGWVRTEQDIKDNLNAGADKVVINTEAYINPEFISDSAQKFGSQCIVISVDVKEEVVYINRGRKNTMGIPLLWANLIQQMGAGEIYLTSITYDGINQGYDINLIKSICNSVSIPVIASGGCGNWQHMAEALDAGADAVSAANIFHYKEHATKQAKDYLIEKGYHMRPSDFWTDKTKRGIVYE